MGGLAWWHWVILLVVVLVLFGGKGKVSDLMGDVAKGIKSFKKGMADEPGEEAAEETPEPKVISSQVAEPVVVKTSVSPEKKKTRPKKVKS